MNTDEILELAQHAARAAERISQCAWGSDDWHDACQAATLGALKALRAGHEGRGYVFIAARNEVLRWHRGNWTRAESLRDSVQCPVPEQAQDDADLPDGWDVEIEALLLRTRTKRGQRGQRAAAADVAVLRLLLRGHSNSEIDRIMGWKADTTDQRRQQLRRRLLQIKQGANT